MARPAPKKRVPGSDGYDPSIPISNASMPDPETLGSPAKWGGSWAVPHGSALGAAAAAAAGIGHGIYSLWKNRPRGTSPAPDQGDIDRAQFENHARQQLQKTTDSATRIGKKGGVGR